MKCLISLFILLLSLLLPFLSLFSLLLRIYIGRSGGSNDNDNDEGNEREHSNVKTPDNHGGSSSIHVCVYI